MSIIKKIKVGVKGDIATTNDLVYIYQNDEGIKYLFDIYDFKKSFNSDNSLLTFYKITEASISIKDKNNNICTETQRNYLTDNCVLFNIDRTMSDELSEVGNYKLYLHLYDKDNSRITIPPIDFEIKELNVSQELYNLADNEENLLIDSESKYILVRG